MPSKYLNSIFFTSHFCDSVISRDLQEAQISILSVSLSGETQSMATTASFSGVQCCVQPSNRAAPVSFQPPVSINVSAKPRGLRTLSSLKLKRKYPIFTRKDDTIGKSSRSFIVRCDAASGKVVIC